MCRPGLPGYEARLIGRTLSNSTVASAELGERAAASVTRRSHGEDVLSLVPRPLRSPSRRQASTNFMGERCLIEAVDPRERCSACGGLSACSA